MQKFWATFFTLYLASMGLSPLWGAHVHHHHKNVETNTYKLFSSKHASILSIHESVSVEIDDTDENDNCARFCDDCTIESLLVHLLENKTFFNATAPVVKPFIVASDLFYTVLDESQEFVQINFVDFITTNPPPLLTGGFVHSSSPRA